MKLFCASLFPAFLTLVPASAQIINPGAGGGGGGATIPSTTNLIKGDGSGNGADSGISPTGTSNCVVASPADGSSGTVACRAAVAADIPVSLPAVSVGGNAATATVATSLASTPTNCAAGSYTLGIDAFGTSQGCTVAKLGTVTSIATTGPITGGPITGTGTIACSTCGITGSPLSQFASTTSAQLLGTLSDPTGTGATVFGTSPTLVTPAITTSFTLTRNAIGSTSMDGIVLINNTAALTGQQQFSPRIHLIGQGWGTTATASAQGEIIMENAPFRDGTVDPRWSLSYIEAGGAQTTLLQSMPLPTGHGYQGLWMGNITPTTTNYALQVDPAVGSLFVNGPTTGVNLAAGNATTASFTSSLANILSGVLCVTQANGSCFKASGTGVIEINNGTACSTLSNCRDLKLRDIIITGEPATTGQRFACLDTNGKIVSSATACVGT